MTLPLFFLCGPEADVPGCRAVCGWRCTPEGALRGPERTGRSDALVFDDSAPLPDRPDRLAEGLLRQAEAMGAGVIVLDFERPVSAGAIALARALAARSRTAAPLPFYVDNCEPIVCYRASQQTFSEFLSSLPPKPCWAELLPVDETIRYPAEDPPMEDGTFFSEALQCHYRAWAEDGALVLRFFDTPESFSHRFSLMEPYLTAAIALPNELQAIDFLP
jgi:hypothetical protein